MNGVYGVAITAEDFKKLIEKGLSLRFFALGALKTFREGERAPAFRREKESGRREREEAWV